MKKPTWKAYTIGFMDLTDEQIAQIDELMEDLQGEVAVIAPSTITTDSGEF